MSNIKGKVKYIIFESTTGFKVGQFLIKSTDDEQLSEYVNKTITFTGTFLELNNQETYSFDGEFVYHEKYGYQFQTTSYSKVEPVGKDAVIEFLSSNLISGCGIKTAEKIVDVLGENAINIIKENPDKLLLVDKMTDKKALRIYKSIMKYALQDELIISLQTMGFTLKETMLIIDKYQEDSLNIIKENIYKLVDIIDFKKIDYVFLKDHLEDDEIRIKGCIIESLKRLEFINGDTYHKEQEIIDILKGNFKIATNDITKYLEELVLSKDIYILEDKIFLADTYYMEEYIALNLLNIKNKPTKPIKNFAAKIAEFEKEYEVRYNAEQKEAIKSALENNVCIITGGPGTGKTTIINAITKLYISEHKLSNIEILNHIALLSPTGRAAKKLSDSTNLPAMTIHRFLKWNKDNNTFQVNEDNKNFQKFIILDETSMIDTNLFCALLKGLYSNIKLIIVGDENQLPSVSCGLILEDLIKSQVFKHIRLNQIYRQSSNSYIPYLAKEIQMQQLSENFLEQKDDYNFLDVPSMYIKESIAKIIKMSKVKGLDEKSLTILAPMYKGNCGIDNLNIMLQNLFNPKEKNKKELAVGEVIYREKDKVLQLVNDPDNNVYNGDIGYIHKIYKDVHNKDVVSIDFDGSYIEYKKDDMYNIKHAYAMSIHKAQGSEFNHVIMPISSAYHKMLYNKLIYTGVSRAKKSLVIIGSPKAFLEACQNSYSSKRKTYLQEILKTYKD